MDIVHSMSIFNPARVSEVVYMEQFDDQKVGSQHFWVYSGGSRYSLQNGIRAVMLIYLVAPILENEMEVSELVSGSGVVKEMNSLEIIPSWDIENQEPGS
jgi:hypothetical protein